MGGAFRCAGQWPGPLPIQHDASVAVWRFAEVARARPGASESPSNQPSKGWGRMRRRTDCNFSSRDPSTAMLSHSLDKSRIKFLLLEGIHSSAVEGIRAAGYTRIETVPGALPDEQLQRSIAYAHFLGIRSRTQMTGAVLAYAPQLVAVGCFCIGTNQVDLNAARERGIAV